MLEIKGKVNTAVCYAKTVEDSAIEQIRRMCETCGYRVTRLVRTRVMNVLLGDLAPGTYRELTAEEMRKLKKLTAQSYSAPKGQHKRSEGKR